MPDAERITVARYAVALGAGGNCGAPPILDSDTKSCAHHLTNHGSFKLSVELCLELRQFFTRALRGLGEALVADASRGVNCAFSAVADLADPLPGGSQLFSCEEREPVL